jgi:hypothetical protein
MQWYTTPYLKKDITKEMESNLEYYKKKGGCVSDIEGNVELDECTREEAP